MHFLTDRGHDLLHRGHRTPTTSSSIVSAPDPPPDPIGNFPPPPTPTCPFVFAGDGVTYSGTHSGGGAVCITLTKDFSGVTWFHALDVPGDTCRIGWKVEHMELPTPVVDRRFSHGSSFARIIGSFDARRGASGTLQMTQLTGPLSFCNSPTLTWKATTTATPPWLDETAAGGAAARQRRCSARCAGAPSPCSSAARGRRARRAPRRPSRASALATGRLTVAKGSRGRTLRLALWPAPRAPSRRRCARASSVRARVTVVATDAAANGSTARRTITLRR